MIIIIQSKEREDQFKKNVMIKSTLIFQFKETKLFNLIVMFKISVFFFSFTVQMNNDFTFSWMVKTIRPFRVEDFPDILFELNDSIIQMYLNRLHQDYKEGSDPIVNHLRCKIRGSGCFEKKKKRKRGGKIVLYKSKTSEVWLILPLVKLETVPSHKNTNRTMLG